MYVSVAGQSPLEFTWHIIDVDDYLEVFSAMRLYAIWGRNRRIFVFILCLGLVYPTLTTVRVLYFVMHCRTPDPRRPFSAIPHS